MTFRRPLPILLILIAIISCGFLATTNSKTINNSLQKNQAAILPLVTDNASIENSVSYELKKVENYCEPVISAKAIIVVYVDKINNINQVLFEKDADKQLPIASLTKLMTALIALENYSLDDKITVSREISNQESGNFRLKPGEEFKVSDLLLSMLIESDNGAGYALAEKSRVDQFVEKMNNRAGDIGLNSTLFFNTTGLDPDDPNGAVNQSTARDIYVLTNYLLDKPLIWNILKMPRINLYSSGNIFHHEIISTNEFLEKRPVLWKDKIIGGKTGWTPMANGCLMLAINAQNGQGKIIAVILGADNRFEEMEKLIDWVLSNYRK